MFEKILITGGAGYLGSVLTQKLMESKKVWSLCDDYESIDPPKKSCSPGKYSWDKVVVYDNLMYGQTSLVNYCYKNDFLFINGDVRDQNKLLPYVEEADIIIPLAAIVGFPACEKNKQLAKEINVDHISFILKNKKKSCKVIYPNTNSGYGLGSGDLYCTEETPLTPISWYGITKCEAERLVLNSGGISLRLATVFGSSARPRLDLLVNDFTYRAYKDKFLVLFEPHFKRNYIHIQDVALVFIKAIIEYEKMKGQVFNVGMTSANLSKLELAELIKKQIPNLSIICDEIGKDPDKRNYIVSNKKLESFGWKPFYTLENGIFELLKSFEILKNNLNSFTNL